MITVEFSETTSAAHQSVFQAAAAKWDSVTDTSFPTTTVEGRSLDGLLIEASIEPIDGSQGVLGQAGPTFLISTTQLPAIGIMQFDTADIARLEAEGSFEDVILHEMAHVLGFGTLWEMKGLINASGTINPLFNGTAASREYATLTSISDEPAVPIANTGGAGTREGHWRELVFGDELLTGFLSGTNRPLSRMSIASFEDLGYRVNYDAADDYQLPSALELAQKGVNEAVRICDLCRMGRPEPVMIDVDSN